MLRQLQEESRWLLHHRSNVTSQFGEDGIVTKALDVLPDRSGWCVEFGAWDGRKYSNTYQLVTSRDYRGVFIEADPKRFRDLQNIHGQTSNYLLNAVVGFDEEDCLDALLKHLPIPRSIDLLSIDIDGNDYHAWDAVRFYEPKLVIIEYNPTIANAVHFVQERRHGVNHGSSPASLVALGNSKGYELIAVTKVNLLFVHAKYYSLFNIPDNSLAVMRDDSEVPHIFVAFDGKILLSQVGIAGAISLPWHGLKLWESDVQVLPRGLQKYRENYSRLEKFIHRCCARFDCLGRL